jgi:exopolysaccharide biosynthesis polyprenyl glycosylphosphotransferase
LVQQQADYNAPQLQVVSSAERPAGAIVPFRGDAHGHAWVTLLAALPHVSPGRLLYFIAGKRLIDLALATIALIALSPLFLLLTILIRRDSAGPAIFKQTRIGRGGTPFTVYKFRTMRADPNGEELKLFRDEHGKLRHKIKHDPRVTKLGRFLRKTSLDELPQLLNVLRGQMSLVGPRPELPQIVQNYEDWQHKRHLVRPGITGWWQVSGRSDLPMHENTGYDIHYVENCSFLLDVKIVAKTVKSTIKGIGAF